MASHTAPMLNCSDCSEVRFGLAMRQVEICVVQLGLPVYMMQVARSLLSSALNEGLAVRMSSDGARKPSP